MPDGNTSPATAVTFEPVPTAQELLAQVQEEQRQETARNQGTGPQSTVDPKAAFIAAQGAFIQAQIRFMRIGAQTGEITRFSQAQEAMIVAYNNFLHQLGII